MADNHVTLVGNLVDNPELRFTPNGAAVANFRLAVTPRMKDGDTWKDGETSFFRINVWRQQAENTAESLTKGARVMVSGKLRSRSWEDSDGNKRNVVEVEADEVAPSLKFVTAKIERTGRSSNGGPSRESKPAPSGQFDTPPPF